MIIINHHQPKYHLYHAMNVVAVVSENQMAGRTPSFFFT